MKTPIKIIILTILLALFGCKKEQQELQPKSFPKEVIKPQKATTYNKNNDYEYSYHVIGNDQNGNLVVGNIYIKEEIGTGFITNNYGEKINVEVKWISYGKLKATDYNGNEYELKVE